jgi:hypothetical protein
MVCCWLVLRVSWARGRGCQELSVRVKTSIRCLANFGANLLALLRLLVGPRLEHALRGPHYQFTHRCTNSELRQRAKFAAASAKKPSCSLCRCSTRKSACGRAYRGHWQQDNRAHLGAMSNRVRATFVCLLVSVGWMVSAGAAQDDEQEWRTIHEDHGVVVSTREQVGKALPSFRGQGDVKGSVLHVLAVVLDDARSKEWAKDAGEAEVLRVLDPRTQIVYTRSHQTWPIRDRDLVMKRTVEVLEPGRAFRVRLSCVAGEKPETPAAIRIKDCDTVFVLRAVDEQTTHVDYRVRADPGGSNPAWAVRWASKNIPLETLLALRRQLTKTKGQYEAVMRSWSTAS